MKKHEISTGRIYEATVSGKITNVRIDSMGLGGGFGANRRQKTTYQCTNLSTGRKVMFKSAAKFRSEVKAKAQGTPESPKAASEPVQATSEPLKPSESILDVSEQSSETPVLDAIEAWNRPLKSDEIDLDAPLCAEAPPESSGFVPTQEQAAILKVSKEIEAAKDNGQRVLVIGAGAGTGKTATLKLLEKTLSGNGQYTAFNSSLCNESRAKFQKCAVNTTHSLAFKEVGRLYSHRLNGNRVKNYQVARMLGIEDIHVTVEDASGSPQVKPLGAAWLAEKIREAIQKFCQSADPEITVKHFPYIDGIDSARMGKRTYDNNDRVKKHLLRFALKAWEDMSRVDGTMPFTHDAYVKIWQLGQGKNRPIIAAEYILLDEAQDTAPVMLDVLRRQEHALLILVGDDNQQIYEWRGAVNAMATFPDATRKLLSQSFRFGQAIADVANSILAGLEEKTDLVMKGLQLIPSRICKVENPRCYLYRSNAGAVGRLMEAMTEGKRGHLIGGSKEVADFCKAAIDLQANRHTSHQDLGSFSNWKEVVAYSKEDEGEDLRLMVKLIEKFGADNIHAALVNMPSESEADLVLSTAHRSKGREWISVKLGSDFPTANRLSDADRRLLYVACTRAQEELDLSACPTFMGGYEKKAEDFRGGDDEENRFIPGIKIKYTQPMPTVEQLVEYRKERSIKEAEIKEQSLLLPQENSPDEEEEKIKEFTWANIDGQWCVRGPANMTGKKVEVLRKNGTKSQEMIRNLIKKVDGMCYYEIAKSR